MIKKKETNDISVLAAIIVALVMVIVAFKVISYGYLPEDDALRHAAKAVSGNNWDQILVMRSGVAADSHPGWHALLSFIHRLTGSGPDGLAVFSVIVLFLFFCVIPIFFLSHPEGWPLVLIILSLADFSLVKRLLYGRPYIVSMAAVAVICFVWQRMKDQRPYKTMALIASFTALATCIHVSWYLFLLPVACFFASRQRRPAIFVALSCACGVAIGAVCTGHPVIFLKQSLDHLFLAFGNHTLARILVSEFQPFTGDALAVVAVAAVLAFRRMRGAWDIKAIDNPVFILAAAGWALGFVSKRFWFDWGMPALAVWMALELQGFLRERFDTASGKRLILAALAGLVFYLAVTNDAGGRWTNNLTTEYLSADDPEQVEWLPAAGGIVYSDDMTIFYDTFFKNPRGPWRYILGFEPALMPPEDLAIFRKIQWNYGAYEAFAPWVAKMRPADRLILRRSPGSEPKIPGLEWKYAATNIWVGRPQPTK